MVDLDEKGELELQSVDVGVANETIVSDVKGIIQGVEDGVLEDLREKSLTPTEIHFAMADE